ncbi:MAG: hypothetical protein BWZ10_01219 [candidate division BRC1 bacterium ADurb.BinA364]|nr:MAG: hypothetical protein BWZ10_01219 [candidate division BRC1 bacterium ADurb.BinA364]
MSIPPPLPSDKERLLREVDASIRIKDLRRLDHLNEAVDFKWWESALILLMFLCALGFIITALVALDAEQSRPETLGMLRKILLGWTIPLVFSFVFVCEMTLLKLRAMRRLTRFTSELVRNALLPERHASAGESENARRE